MRACVRACVCVCVCVWGRVRAPMYVRVRAYIGHTHVLYTCLYLHGGDRKSIQGGNTILKIHVLNLLQNEDVFSDESNVARARELIPNLGAASTFANTLAVKIIGVFSGIGERLSLTKAYYNSTPSMRDARWFHQRLLTYIIFA